ncbi:hypothetical protein CDAR_429981 [Caerostris darwini]|uniref:Uncharacterized protein n=1 Tax=Caerostris darwini TaxID=1538125 RepID=A0AAV4RWE0_9ARAC|nr:hypothetical protein CDAR_429981 [Caerostris darwini]
MTSRPENHDITQRLGRGREARVTSLAVSKTDRISMPRAKSSVSTNEIFQSENYVEKKRRKMFSGNREREFPVSTELDYLFRSLSSRRRFYFKGKQITKSWKTGKKSNWPLCGLVEKLGTECR